MSQTHSSSLILHVQYAKAMSHNVRLECFWILTYTQAQTHTHTIISSRKELDDVINFSWNKHSTTGHVSHVLLYIVCMDTPPMEVLAFMVSPSTSLTMSMTNFRGPQLSCLSSSFVPSWRITLFSGDPSMFVES